MFCITSGVAKAAFPQASRILGSGGMPVRSSLTPLFGRMSSSTGNIGQVSGKNLLTFGALQPTVQRPVLEELIAGQEVAQHVVDGMQNCEPRLWAYGDQEKISEQLLELLMQKPLTSNAAMTLRFLNDLLEDDQNSLAKAMLREDSSYIHVEPAALKTVLGSLHIFDNPEIKARLIESATAELDKTNPDPEMLDVIMKNVGNLADNPRAQLSIAWAIWEGGFGDDQERFEKIGQELTDPKAKLIIDSAIKERSFGLSNIDTLKKTQSLVKLLNA